MNITTLSFISPLTNNDNPHHATLTHHHFFCFLPLTNNVIKMPQQQDNQSLICFYPEQQMPQQQQDNHSLLCFYPEQQLQAIQPCHSYTATTYFDTPLTNHMRTQCCHYNTTTLSCASPLLNDAVSMPQHEHNYYLFCFYPDQQWQLHWLHFHESCDYMIA